MAPVPTVTPDPDSHLGQLAALWAKLTPELAQLNEQMDACKAALKAELYAELLAKYPTALAIDLVADVLDKPLRLTAKAQARIDSKALREKEPDLYEQFVNRSSTWELRAR